MIPTTRTMLRLWEMDKRDWFGYILDQNSCFTYHHCFKKKCHGGRVSVANGAILIDKPHEYLHIIEKRDFEMYLFLNNILKDINRQRYMPTTKQLMIINYVLEQFEKEHCGEKNEKGRPLIKEEYVKRLIR